VDKAFGSGEGKMETGGRREDELDLTAVPKLRLV
jgi:hypothetical protein